jgi:hypothetical protein
MSGAAGAASITRRYCSGMRRPQYRHFTNEQPPSFNGLKA